MDFREHWRWMAGVILFLVVAIGLADRLFSNRRAKLEEGLTWPKSEATITHSKLSETFVYHQHGPTRTRHIIELGLDLNADGIEDQSLVHTTGSSPGTFDTTPFAVGSPATVHLAPDSNSFVLADPILVRID